MKIAIEEEIDGMKRTCIAVYTGNNTLISSCWIEGEDDAYSAMRILKEILEPIILRYVQEGVE